MVTIITGTIEVEPQQRDDLLASQLAGIERSRAEPGCMACVMGTDPIEPRPPGWEAIVPEPSSAGYSVLGQKPRASRNRQGIPFRCLIPKGASDPGRALSPTSRSHEYDLHRTGIR
jgi:hypothetical protein